MMLPDWVIEELRALYSKYDNKRSIIRPFAKAIWDKLGYKPSPQEIYDALNDITEEDRIAPCGKEKRFDGKYFLCGKVDVCPCAKDKMIETNLERYGTACSLSSTKVRNKVKETMLDRYGVENPSHNSNSVSKRIETNIEKYGSASPLGNKQKREEGKLTSLSRYGDEIAQRSQVIRDKTRETVRERFGVDYLQQSQEMRQKSKETLQERYGVDTALAHPEFNEKRLRTNMERYGFEHVVLNPDVKEKSKKTNIEKHGLEYPCQHNIPTKSHNILNDSIAMIDLMETNSLSTVANDLGVHPSTVSKYAHRHGITIERSTYEKEIKSFLSEMNIDVLVNRRRILQNLELDFYIPEHNFAIEFNGIYWHSSFFKEKLYHRHKYEACVERGIRLLMINEDEWNDRPDAIKSHIGNILGKSEKGLGARKLKIEQVSGAMANDFFDKHHIQGRTGSMIYSVGAFDGYDLVSVMAFNKQRGTGDIELIRFCSSGKSHAGAFSRLFKRSITDNAFDHVISFADLRYSLGDVYHKNGFSLVDEVNPDYRYVWKNRTWHKSTFTKKRIAEKFDIDMSSITEREAMEELNIPRIYDCGKLKFEWRRGDNPSA